MRFLLLSVSSLALFPSSDAARKCDASVGGGTCPDENTCCPLYDGSGHRAKNASACLPPNKHIAIGPGVCCGRSLRPDAWGETVTGCPHGYRCASNIDEFGNIQEYCQRVAEDIGTVSIKFGRRLVRKRDQAKSNFVSSAPSICSNGTDALHPFTFPRYSLCSLPSEAFEETHGLPVRRNSEYELAYYSNKGPLARYDRNLGVRMVVIAIHGSSRNADDYLCAAHSASRLQMKYHPDSVLVVAPRFLVPGDQISNFLPHQVGGLPLLWNETGPITHTWRYGADSIYGGISSYEAMDVLVQHFVIGKGKLYPKLEAISLIGHSAGGQFVQRYILLSSLSVLDSDKFGIESSSDTGIQFRSVAANPRSYCYLDGRRFSKNGHDEYKFPSAGHIAACPRYDQWQWGISEGGDLVAPYKDRSIVVAGGIDALRRRFLQRNVTYLAGAMDILPLQGTCEDDAFQGECRLERAHYYFKSIQTLFNATNHIFRVVDGSNHDHTFMFESPMALDAIFGI